MKVPDLGDRFIEVRERRGNRIIEICNIDYVNFGSTNLAIMCVYFEPKDAAPKEKSGFEVGSDFHKRLIPDSNLSRLLYGVDD